MKGMRGIDCTPLKLIMMGRCVKFVYVLYFVSVSESSDSWFLRLLYAKLLCLLYCSSLSGTSHRCLDRLTEWPAFCSLQGLMTTRKHVLINLGNTREFPVGMGLCALETVVRSSRQLNVFHLSS